MAESGDPFSLEPTEVPHVETTNRRIVTPIPPPETAALLERLRRVEPLSMSLELPVAWSKAEGFHVEDGSGNRWLDFTSGIFVANVGHGHPRVRAAISELTERPLLHTYSFANEPRLRFGERMVGAAPAQLDSVLLLSTGAEANEVVIKCMRNHGRRTRPDKLAIVSMTLGFHGKTMGAQTASGRDGAKEWIGQLDPNFHQIPVPFPPVCPWHDEDRACGADCFERGMQQLADRGVDLGTIAGFIAEPFQGWSAAFLPDEFVASMRSWATEHDALLAFDEVQSGFGRTGRLLAHEHFGVEADLVSCGKGIASGLPLSAVLARRELVAGDDSLHSTHSGNPVCCAAADATLAVLQDEQLVEAAAAVEPTVRRRLEELAGRFSDHVTRIEGRGLVWAVHLGRPGSAELDAELGDLTIERAMRRGLLLVRTGTGTIKIGPPLSITEDALLEGIDVFEEGLAQAIDERVASAL